MPTTFIISWCLHMKTELLLLVSSHQLAQLLWHLGFVKLRKKKYYCGDFFSRQKFALGVHVWLVVTRRTIWWQSGVVSHNIRQKDANFSVIMFVYFVFIKKWNLHSFKIKWKEYRLFQIWKKNQILLYRYFHLNQLLFNFLILHEKD